MGNISIIEKVENAIDEIRPYLIADGGDIKVVSVDNKNVVNNALSKVRGGGAVGPKYIKKT